MEKLIDALLVKVKQYNPELGEAQLRTRKFGLECLVSEVSKTLIYLLVFLLLGMPQYFLVSFLVYCTIRITSGGYHANGYWTCFAVSLAVFMISVYAGRLLPMERLVLIPVLVILLVINGVFAPVDHPNKPNKDPEKRKKFKIISTALVFSWGAISFLLPEQMAMTVAVSILFAVGMQPVGKVLNRPTAMGR